MAEISASCFYDRCDECDVGTCSDHCHRTIADIDQTIAALKTIRNVTEEMLGSVLAGLDRLAAPAEPTD